MIVSLEGRLQRLEQSPRFYRRRPTEEDRQREHARALEVYMTALATQSQAFPETPGGRAAQAAYQRAMAVDPSDEEGAVKVAEAAYAATLEGESSRPLGEFVPATYWELLDDILAGVTKS